MQPERVVIVGAGFGGLRAARSLAGTGMDVLLLDRENYHLFQPLLYQVATASLEQEAIAYPVRSILRRWKGVRFRLGEVTGIDLARRRVLLGEEAIDYDSLVLAAGGVTNFFGLESIGRRAYDLKHLPRAARLRSHILSVFEEAAHEADPARRKALLSFVVVGGGPTGVEFAGALAELVHHVFPLDYPELSPEESRIVLVERQQVLPAFSGRLQRYAVNRLERMGVEVVLGRAVQSAEEDRVHLDNGDEIAACTLLWAAGIKASPLADGLDVPRARGADQGRAGPDAARPPGSDRRR